ncbi:MAG: hypothetical protein OXI53_05645 [Nitrospira sp.]|nr:hypothetical protein [Nitrospira sp.]MDE0404776.1 hypothetical protein [Nitrospira sp.]
MTVVSEACSCLELTGSGTCLAWYGVRPGKARGEPRAACRSEPEPALPVLILRLQARDALRSGCTDSSPVRPERSGAKSKEAKRMGVRPDRT